MPINADRVRHDETVQLRTRARALAAADGIDVDRYLVVVADYLSFWACHEQGSPCTPGSVERYLLGWCEDPTGFVIDVLCRLSDRRA